MTYAVIFKEQKYVHCWGFRI